MESVLFWIGGALLVIALLLIVVGSLGKRFTERLRTLFIIFVVMGVLVVGCGFLYKYLPPADKPPASAVSDESPAPVDTSVTFEDIYRDRKANELVADERYNGNRYRITAKINGIETGGLFNLTGGATLTMETRVDNTTVFFYAEFEKEQEEALKQVVVGDTITFEGKCYGGSFSECEIIK